MWRGGRVEGEVKRALLVVLGALFRQSEGGECSGCWVTDEVGGGGTAEEEAVAGANDGVDAFGAENVVGEEVEVADCGGCGGEGEDVGAG